jgi:hypothetical protein
MTLWAGERMAARPLRVECEALDIEPAGQKPLESIGAEIRISAEIGV